MHALQRRNILQEVGCGGLPCMESMIGEVTQKIPRFDIFGGCDGCDSWMKLADT